MFVVSKIFGVLSQPDAVLLALVGLGTVLCFSKRRLRLGRALLVSASLAMIALAVLPLTEWLLGPLEDRFPQPSNIPAHVDGIIVLGGAIDPVTSALRGQVAVGGAVERLTGMVALARQFPAARIIFTGGSGSLTNTELKEAEPTRRFLAEIGFDISRVVFEAESRNTRENAVFSTRLMQPQAGETWLLVTSAVHMPRSVGVFRAVGWPVTAWPVDYLSTGRPRLQFNPGAGRGALAGALHEWTGLIAYRLRGWTNALFPAPIGEG
ncbi:MAG: YdcF family protein [Magnetospirillum sp.]|nr:YdcF family protein [Magnetospirillum sp.]